MLIFTGNNRMRMRKQILPAVIALLAATTLSAQGIKPLDDGKYSVENGAVTLTVDAAHGGKILSFRHGEQEVIAQNEAAAPAPAPAEGQPRRRWFNPNSYGSTFWTSPQAEWNWPPVPEYDSLPYEAEVKDNALFLKGQVSKYGYRICKTFKADPADGAIVVTYSIVNESGEERSVAPWEITRVPNGGSILFDAQPEGVTPADLMKVSFGDGVARLDIDEANENRKINVDGKGWLAFRDHGIVLLKKFQDIAPSEAAPGEAEIQVYINARKTFVEIEAQGPYTKLQPGEALDWTVRWYLLQQ